MNNRILLLCQSHAHVAALTSCIPHLKAHYQWVWVVYSPAVLADPVLVEQKFDQDIADLVKHMKDCYAREDGTGGDAYKVKRDAAILEKTAKVKDAWKSLPKEQQTAAVNKLFMPFFETLREAGKSVSISQALDHFETAAHVEFQNSLKARMREDYLPGDYVVAWPTSLPKDVTGIPVTLAGADLGFGKDTKLTFARGELPQAVKDSVERAVQRATEAEATPKVDKRKKENRKPLEPRLTELMRMDLDSLGPIAFELGIKPNDPIAGKRMALVHRIHELEKERLEKETAAV